jgi:hypothetical protein
MIKSGSPNKIQIFLFDTDGQRELIICSLKNVKAMGLFKRWFGKSDNANSKEEYASDTIMENIEPAMTEELAPEIAEEVWEDTTPVEEPAKEEVPAEPVKKASDLAVFLKTDYLTEGFNIGYTYHSADQLEISLKHLKAMFRLLIDQGIDARVREIADLKQELIQSSGISERLKRQLELRIESLNENIERFQIEKELSVADEGMIARVVHSYNEGYMRGIEQYRKEKFIAGSTGFFN